MSSSPVDISAGSADNTTAPARQTFLTLGNAIFITILAVIVRVLLTPSIGAQFPFSTVYFAVTFAAWYGVWRPALVSATLGYLCVAFFIIPPYHSFLLKSTADYIGASIFFFLCLTSALFSEAQRRAQSR